MIPRENQRRIHLDVGEKRIAGLVDTGAARNFIRRDLTPSAVFRFSRIRVENATEEHSSYSTVEFLVVPKLREEAI